jgi:hypothetical protein
LDRDLDKTDREKEGLVSPMTPGVGKFPWHSSLYGSEVKLLLLLLLLSSYLGYGKNDVQTNSMCDCPYRLHIDVMGTALFPTKIYV